MQLNNPVFFIHLILFVSFYLVISYILSLIFTFSKKEWSLWKVLLLLYQLLYILVFKSNLYLFYSLHSYNAPLNMSFYQSNFILSLIFLEILIIIGIVLHQYLYPKYLIKRHKSLTKFMVKIHLTCIIFFSFLSILYPISQALFNISF